MTKRAVTHNPPTPEEVAQADRVLTSGSTPPATRGLGRLRAAPGAEAVRSKVVAEQAAAMAAERAAPHHTVHSVLPVKVRSRVADQRAPYARLGLVLHTHVHVQVGGKLNGKPYPPLYGHVVHWGGDDIELVDPKHLRVLL